MCWKNYAPRFACHFSASTHRRQHPNTHRHCSSDSRAFSSDERNTCVAGDKADINGFGINSWRVSCSGMEIHRKYPVGVKSGVENENSE